MIFPDKFFISDYHYESKIVIDQLQFFCYDFFISVKYLIFNHL